MAEASSVGSPPRRPAGPRPAALLRRGRRPGEARARPALEERASIASLWSEVSPGAAIVAVVEPPSHWKAAFARVGDVERKSPTLEQVEALGVAVGRAHGDEAVVRVRASSSEGAERVAATVAEWVKTPPTSIEPPWDSVLETGEVTRHGRDVVVRLDVSSLAEPR